MTEHVWVRVGDAGEYEQFGDLGAAFDYLNELSIGEVEGWLDGPHVIGIETPNYWGDNCVSIFWGDSEGNLIRPLDRTERILTENTLLEAYL